MRSEKEGRTYLSWVPKDC
jgi:hypothetical protein